MFYRGKEVTQWEQPTCSGVTFAKHAEAEEEKEEGEEEEEEAEGVNYWDKCET